MLQTRTNWLEYAGRSTDELSNGGINEADFPGFADLVEQICSAMSASGAVVAVRDSEGIRCVASAGDAPAIGSRLQPDSTFTRGCLETGEVALCEDTEKDPRIQPAVARSLNLRSAVAVPIHTEKNIVGIIEVFSSRPSDIHAGDVVVLKQFANLFANMIVPGSSAEAQPAELGASSYWLRSKGFSPEAEQRETKVPPANQRSTFEPRLDPRQSPITPGSACSAVRSRFQRQEENLARAEGRRKDLKRNVTDILLRFAGKSDTAQRWRRRAASVSLLAMLFFGSSFLASAGPFRPIEVKPAPESATPPTPGKVEGELARTRGRETQVGNKVKAGGSHHSGASSQLEASHSNRE
jgi:GAF domain